jgi:hypothetical protein
MPEFQEMRSLDFFEGFGLMGALANLKAAEHFTSLVAG